MFKILNWRLFLEKVGNLSISNKDSYIEGMNKTLIDKSFFMDKLNYDVIVDFGCADGSLLEYVSKINPSIKIIGYDLDKDMLSKAKSKLGEDALITDDWDEVVSSIQYYEKPLLNLSSVIHEVYSYSNSNVIKSFWENQVFGGDFLWVVIRDMIPSVRLGKKDISKFKDDVRNVKMKSDKKYLDSFENRWGTISNNYRTFIHYLLKYRFIENWEREVNENYLPVSIETVINKIPSDYKIVYQDRFVLPFLKKQVKKDFNIDLFNPTHAKMIIKNNKFRK